MAKVALCYFFLSTAVVSGGSSSSSDLDQPFTKSFSRLDHAACVTLYYRNGRIGCGTVDHSLQIGNLEYFDGSNIPQTHDAYVAVMEDYMLEKDSVALLQNALSGGKLQGVLVLNSTSTNEKDQALDWYNPEPLYPQGYGTPSEKVNYGNVNYEWNTMGSGIIQVNLYGLPIAYVKDSSVSNSLRQEAQDSSVDSEIVAEFNYYMGSENMNSIDCLAWKDVVNDQWSPKCLPVGGTSVWAAAGPPPSEDQNDAAKKIFVVGASMDATALFHDLTPGENTAASNILTLVMAAKLVGQVDDETLAALNHQIVFALFQAEAHGFVGSRAFFRDLAYPGFTCNSEIVRSVPRLNDRSEYACLDPLYPSLTFTKLGEVVGMLSLDQLGIVTNGNNFYVHADKNNDQYGAFMVNLLKQFKTNAGFSAYETSTYNNGNGYPYPPSPLTSLLSLSGGAVGGAVLTGYDHAFSSSVPYHSFKETANYKGISLKAIASAATITARAAIAAAYDGGDYDYGTAATYASSLIAELDENDGSLISFSNCLLYNGECEDLQRFASIRASNEVSKTGFSAISQGASLGKPPNYYVGVYNIMYGQPFVQVGDARYGRYDGKDFGKNNDDAIGKQPTALENAIHGLLDEFLGRGSSTFAEKKCKKQADCDVVEFCENQEFPTCTGGGVCVCSRARFHRALDESLEAAVNMPTGYFIVSDNDAGVSPMFTEPFWSSNVGVRVYRDVGPLPGLLTLVAGAVGMASSLCAAFLVRVGLQKQKLY